MRARAAALVFAVLLPAGAAPQAAPPATPWSVRTAETVMTRHPQTHAEWDYTAGLVLLAVDEVGRRTGDPRFAAYVTRNMERMVGQDGSIRTYDREEYNLDQVNQGKLLFRLFERTGDARYRLAAEELREQLRHQPRTTEGGFWHKQVYPHQMWLDGIYMASPFLAQYGTVAGDTAALTDAARQVLLIGRHTRDVATGLFYHGWDESRTQAWADPKTGLSPSFWGRAVGWYAMGIVDVLDWLPTGHPDRDAIIRLFQQLAQAVASVQDPVTGLWYDVLDQPNRAGNYHEASVSSMLVYALAKGARLGYLAPQYRAIAVRGYDGIIRHMVTVDAAGLVTLDRVVAVSGLGGKQQRSGTFEYYVSEPVVANDFKGVGAFILASLELDR